MSKKIITIGRQCGSGGHTIGKALAEKLNIPLYDREFLEEISKRSGLSEDVVEQEGEYSSANKVFNTATGFYRNYDMKDKASLPLREQINAYQMEYIKEVASQGPCVIVGRCADFVLRDRNDCLNVFIRSDLDKRVCRVIEEHRVPDEEAEMHIKDRDRKRADHYKYITGQVWGDVNNYHICLDSGFLGLDACIELIVKCYTE